MDIGPDKLSSIEKEFYNHRVVPGVVTWTLTPEQSMQFLWHVREMELKLAMKDGDKIIEGTPEQQTELNLYIQQIQDKHGDLFRLLEKGLFNKNKKMKKSEFGNKLMELSALLDDITLEKSDKLWNLFEYQKQMLKYFFTIQSGLL